MCDFTLKRRSGVGKPSCKRLHWHNLRDWIENMVPQISLEVLNDSFWLADLTVIHWADNAIKQRVVLGPATQTPGVDHNRYQYFILFYFISPSLDLC